MSTINERIKQRRTKLGLTLKEVAIALEVKEPTVQRYESGEIKNIKYETIEALSNILNCTPCYLMGWENMSNCNKVNKNNFSLNEIEKQIIIAYRQADDITKTMVLRSLSLEEKLAKNNVS